MKNSKTQFSKMIPSLIYYLWHTYFWDIVPSAVKEGTNIAISLRESFLDKQTDKLSEEYMTGNGSEITLTNNEIKDTM